MARILFSFLVAAQLFAALGPDEILKKAEFIRNPEEEYQVKVLLADKKGDKTEVRSYETWIKGRPKSLVKFVTPEVDKGTRVLMIEEQMWIYVPTTAKPIKISPKQKLLGNAAYGDITRLSFVGNYQAKLLREDKFKSAPAYVLDLTALPDHPVTYDRVEYWVDKKSFRPLKAIYMTTAGKALREGYFDKFSDVLGVTRPTNFILVDHLQKNHTTLLRFVAPRRKKMPEMAFEKQNLGRE